MPTKSENKNFDVIFHGSESAMVIFRGPDMVVEMFNKKYHEIYHNRTILGQSIFEAVPELKTTSFPKILQKVYESGEPHITREGLVHITNVHTGKLEERYFDTTFSRISFDGDTFCILAVPREVTNRVEVRKKLEESLRDLEEERELRERFVSALSHDLRTPLAIVKMCSMILKKKNKDANSVLEMADKITTSVARADRMIHDLLDASRIKAGVGIPLVIQECLLDECVKYVIDDLKELHGPRFEIKNTSTEIRGFWDNMGVQRILENLLSNAVKYGAPDSLITVKLSTLDNAVKIQVHNEGAPILEKDQADLFNLYRRSNSVEGNGLAGWGIGLALVKGLTEAHRGSVSVYSSIDDGTTFNIYLPKDSRAI